MLLDNKRIFIVEDNVNNYAIMATILQQQGAHTGYERWGNDTLQRLSAFTPIDLILLDLMFPNGVTGYDIFDQIRQDPKFAAIPIVAVTAADPAVEIPKVRRKGFTAFIGKPVRLGIFERQIAAVLDGQVDWTWDSLL
ncbi:MAG: response regulator [Chloroflexi bacterium]|nr:response regulator [Chloroflexota bacterium]